MAHANHTRHLTDTEEALIGLFCLVDDAYTSLNPRARRYESLKRLSDSEVITLALFRQSRRAEERERAERYCGVYTSLGLRGTAHKDGTLELAWRAGKGVSEVCASPRCTASATTLSSSARKRLRVWISRISPGACATGISASGRTGYWSLSPRRLLT